MRFLLLLSSNLLTDRAMAKDEMDTITEDRWDEDIWGVEQEDPGHKYRAPKLIFYFGQNVRFSRLDSYLESRVNGGRITGLRTILEMRSYQRGPKEMEI